ncbi:MAG: chemotaxis protein CheX [bacterium]
MSSPEENLNILMVTVVSRVLENMAFMEVMECDTIVMPHDIPNLAWCSLLVKDPVLGEFKLFMPKNLNLKIAEAVYGLSDEELTDQILDDTLGELLNTIAGSFFKKVLSDDQTFTLGLPVIASLEKENETGAMAPSIHIDSPSIEWNFTLEGEPLLLASSGETLVNWLHSLEV